MPVTDNLDSPTTRTLPEWMRSSRGSSKKSPHPRQFLWLLCAGKGEKEIAAELGPSVCTVLNHVVRLNAELKVHSRGELLSRVLSAGPKSRELHLPHESLNEYVNEAS